MFQRAEIVVTRALRIPERCRHDTWRRIDEPILLNLQQFLHIVAAQHKILRFKPWPAIRRRIRIYRAQRANIFIEDQHIGVRRSNLAMTLDTPGKLN